VMKHFLCLNLCKNTTENAAEVESAIIGDDHA
jgi:hypothetical protein